jgi:hypothetical protein
VTAAFANTLAVHRVARYGMAAVRRVNPNLVHAAREKIHFYDAHALPPRGSSKSRHGLHARRTARGLAGGPVPPALAAAAAAAV